MGILKDGLYINCNKITKRQRAEKPVFTVEQKEIEGVMQDVNVPVMDGDKQKTEDTLFFSTMVNIFDSVAKENRISIWVELACPYKESITDEDIYTLLKTKVISYKDAFGRKVEIDLTEGVTDVLENTL